jgi:hypothetical protein
VNKDKINELDEENAWSSENLNTGELSEHQNKDVVAPMQLFNHKNYIFDTNQNSSMFKSGKSNREMMKH